MPSIVPLGDHLVVQPMTEGHKSAAGILLPEKEEKPQKGKVLAVGNGRKNDNGSVAPLEVKVGDMVLFKKYSPDEFEIEGEKVLVLREEDVLAKLV